MALAQSDLPDAQAAERLNRHRSAAEKEERAVTSSTMGGVTPVLPLWVDGVVMAAVRSSAPLYAALDKLPLPPEGTTIEWSKFTTGSTTAVQNPENTAVSSTDPAASFDAEPLSTVEGFVQYSFQVRDRGVGADEQIGRDLGAAFGAKIESELWLGTGSSGRIKGLTQASPGTSVAAGGQTAANNLGVVWNTFQQLTVAFGRPADLLVVHPRRSAWWAQAVVGAPARFVPNGVTLIESPAAPGNLGGGSEDWPHFLVRDSVQIATDGPQLDIQTEQAGTSLTAQAVLRCYVAFATSARPEAIARITALTNPTFS